MTLLAKNDNDAFAFVQVTQKCSRYPKKYVTFFTRGVLLTIITEL